ncbi:MAG: zf-HC2 domain-containing protein, partial [Ardenticatenaceae bacterium]
MNEHERIEQLLASYPDLSPDERREVDEHIRECEDCAAALGRDHEMDRRVDELMRRRQF